MQAEITQQWVLEMIERWSELISTDEPKQNKFLVLGEEILALGEKILAPASYKKALTQKNNTQTFLEKVDEFSSWMVSDSLRCSHSITPPNRERSIILASACDLEIPKVIVDIIITMSWDLYDATMEMAYKIQRQWVGIAPIQEKIPMTLKTLQWKTPAEKKRLIGNRLYAKIQLVEPRLAGRITGMMLESKENHLLCIFLRDPCYLMCEINEALAALKYHQRYGLFTIYE